MYNAKIRKSKRILTLFMIITTIFVLNFIPFNLNSQDLLAETDSFEDTQLLNELEAADYSLSYSSTGDNFNVTLHQSLVNTTRVEFDNIDNANSFKEACPVFNGFNSSFINITIEDIFAPNKSITYEDDVTGAGEAIFIMYAASIELRDSCYIENVSIYLRNDNDATAGSVRLNIYNSSWQLVSGDYRVYPDGNYTAQESVRVPVPDNHNGWIDFIDLHTYLDVTQTENNTFFVVLIEDVDMDTWWEYRLDIAGTDPDDTVCYQQQGSNWILVDKLGPNPYVDFLLKCDYSIENNYPKPTDINLRINSTVVTDVDSDNKGNCIIEEEYGSTSGELNFEVTTDWWDVECNITRVQINYTKSDIKANSNFDILGSSQDVNWTVSIPGALNYFDDQFTEFNTINFTIPSTWDKATIQVFNGSLEIPGSSIDSDFVSFPFREVQVLHATNGSNWYLTANSTNLLSSITVEGDIDYTAKFSETVRFNATFIENVSEGILNLSVYSPIPRYMNHTKEIPIVSTDNVFTVSDWDISTEAEEYGIYLNQMFWNNGTAAGLIKSYLIIIGDTSIDVLDPPEDSIYKVGEFIDIIVEYNDTRFSQGVPDTDAIINYSLNEGADYLYENVTYLGDGRHNISINVNHPHFTEFGFVDVLINCSGRFYENKTIEFTFHRQITTYIDPDNTATLGPIIRGQNVSFTFSYNDTLDNPIKEANWSVIGSNRGFQSFLENHNNGSYTIHLDSDNVNVAGSPFTIQFNISAIGNETQIITLTIYVNIINTEIINTSYFDTVSRSSGLNQTFTFYFNDTTNNEPVKNITTSDVIVKDYSTGSVWEATGFDWILSNGTGDGNYILNISLKDIDSGTYNIEVNVSKAPNYNYSLYYFSFYLRGNYSQINLISVSDPGGQLSPVGNYNFTIFEGSDITIEFNMTDLEYDNKLVSTLADSYTIRYQDLNTAANGIIASRAWEIVTLNHRGEVLTSDSALVTGNYEINITISKLNYEDVSFVLNLTVIQKYQANLTTITPESVNAGLPFKIIIKAEYYNGSVWLPIYEANITIIPYYNGIAGQSLGSYLTNSTGEVEFEIPTYSDTRTLNLTIQLTTAYYHQAYSTEISDIIIIPSAGLTFEDLIPYLILIGAAVAVVAGSVAIHRGVVVPKKREKTRILTEVKTIFDDAINLEHVLVLYKGTGTCIFFKSFGSEQIDPELISGFISAICSFGKDLVSQEELNEITYGDKMLLLSDGEFIRIALVLGKKASLILRRNLMEFIHSFERVYANNLPNWRGRLNIFRDAGRIVDEILSTSIILPHEITYEHSNVKVLKNPQSRDVLKIANNLIKDSERNFFFIATLLKEATEKTGKNTAEIFIGIKELRDTKILMPIEISTIEKQPISQQEMNLINQKISTLVNLTPEERQKLVNELAQVGPAEREAYFVSLAEQHEIVSAPIEFKPGATVIETIKEAKKELKNLKKIAMVAKKKKDYEKSMKIFQNAAKIALNWELVKESQKINDLMRQTKIEDLYKKMKALEKEAKVAVKKENFNEAAQKYKISSKIASEIFKLGITYMTKEVKRLSNKAKEYEKLV